MLTRLFDILSELISSMIQWLGIKLLGPKITLRLMSSTHLNTKPFSEKSIPHCFRAPNKIELRVVLKNEIEIQDYFVTESLCKIVQLQDHYLKDNFNQSLKSFE